MGADGCYISEKLDPSNLTTTTTKPGKTFLQKCQDFNFSNKDHFDYYAKLHINEVIKIQSSIKGFLERKKLKGQIKKKASFSNTVPEEVVWKPIDKVPDYTTKEVKETEKKLIIMLYGTLPINRNLFIYKGPQISESEIIYDGEWNERNEKNGTGIQYYPDGSKYNGYWKNNMQHGKGRFIYSNGNAYIGNFVANKPDGFGEMINFDGSKYKGEWKEGKEHGHGIQTWSDGSSYDGYYKFGKKEGKGFFKWIDGSFYEGNFKKNKMNGFGIYQWPGGNRYKGDWKDDKMHGKGIFKWVDGKIYDGEYFENMKHGKGECIWPNQSKYIGKWFKGKLHGKGIFYDAEGRKMESERPNGEIFDGFD